MAQRISRAKRTVSEVNYSGDFEDIYQAIDCDTFTCVQASERGDTLYVDDEGLINGKEQAFFGWMGYPQPLAGKALLLGTDLVKDTSRLLRAYDDDQGVTARFNLNALSVMNSQLDADFEVDAFRHRAWWDDRTKRIQMHLVATRDTCATVGAFDELRVEVREGKHLLTEYSTKFTRDQVHQELAAVGLAVLGSWTDEKGDFLVTLARRAG